MILFFYHFSLSGFIIFFKLTALGVERGDSGFETVFYHGDPCFVDMHVVE
jgi:hypothetical protein